MVANPNIKRPNTLGGPAICECNTGWHNDDLIRNQQYIQKCACIILITIAKLLTCVLLTVGENLNALIIMHYPTDNCPALDGTRVSGQALIDKTQRLFNDYAKVHSAV
jgi:hypothetical protein